VAVFRDALAGTRLAAIAEVKRRSPSGGDLRPDADPARLAGQFAQAGAAAVSILVDERFGGSLADLHAARAATSVPLLAKGFFRHERQLLELKQAGADAALLILRDVDDASAESLLASARELGLDVLVEVHDVDEIDRVVALEADIVGVNARDLSTFEIDRRAQLDLVRRIRDHDRLVVAESGVWSRAQGAAAELAGADAVLVGSALMRAPDPAAKLRELLSRPLVKVCGLTRQEDVDVAVDAGADMLGFILVDASPRQAPGVLEVPDDRLSVAVFVGEAADTGADLVQLYRRETGRVRGREAELLRDGETVARVIDLPWHRGDPLHLQRAAAERGRVMLAGKLDSSNVANAVRAVRPWAVDAASRLESKPGVKDHDKVCAFVAAAR
jgi:indole-3-glycerol phosphate synthase